MKHIATLALLVFAAACGGGDEPVADKPVEKKPGCTKNVGISCGLAARRSPRSRSLWVRPLWTTPSMGTRLSVP